MRISFVPTGASVSYCRSKPTARSPWAINMSPLAGAKNRLNSSANNFELLCDRDEFSVLFILLFFRACCAFGDQFLRFAYKRFDDVRARDFAHRNAVFVDHADV